LRHTKFRIFCGGIILNYWGVCIHNFGVFLTQIEIHPGAVIENGVFIDHGSGLVIGETAIVETGAKLYHGVTLGGTGKDTGKRHPSVRRGALISAHAQLLGPIEIGENARVGASAVVTKDVPSCDGCRCTC
jgi:serine O-acetyltransferase